MEYTGASGTSGLNQPLPPILIPIAVDKSLCSCGKGDDGRFMVFCESCQRWFHGECVGITTKDAEKIETFHCPKCREKDLSSFTEKRRTRFPASLSKQEKLEYDNTWKGTIRKANLFSIAVHGALLGGAFRTEWIGTSLEIDGMIDRQTLFNYVENLKNLALFKQIGFVALSPETADTTYRWVLDRLKTNDKAVLLHNEKIDEPVHNELYVALVPIAGAVPSCLKAHKLPSGEFLLMVVVSSATV